MNSLWLPQTWLIFGHVSPNSRCVMSALMQTNHWSNWLNITCIRWMNHFRKPNKLFVSPRWIPVVSWLWLSEWTQIRDFHPLVPFTPSACTLTNEFNHWQISNSTFLCFIWSWRLPELSILSCNTIEMMGLVRFFFLPKAFSNLVSINYFKEISWCIVDIRTLTTTIPLRPSEPLGKDEFEKCICKITSS